MESEYPAPNVKCVVSIIGKKERVVNSVAKKPINKIQISIRLRVTNVKKWIVIPIKIVKIVVIRIRLRGGCHG